MHAVTLEQYVKNVAYGDATSRGEVRSLSDIRIRGIASTDRYRGFVYRRSFWWRASSAMSTAISQLSRFQVWRIIFFDNILPNKKCSSLSKLLCYSFTSSTHNLKLLSFLNYPAYLDPRIVMKTVFPRKGPIFKQSPITFNTVEIKEIERIDGPKSEHFLKHKMFRSWYEHSSAI